MATKQIRITNSLSTYHGGELSGNYRRASLFNEGTLFDPNGHFARTLNYGNALSTNDIAPDPMTLSKTVLFSRAINKISDGVANLPWVIDSIGRKSTDQDIPIIESLSKAIRHPNIDEHTTYRQFIRAIVRDILVFNVSTIERKSGKVSGLKESQPFWSWVVCPKKIYLNQDWNPFKTKIEPRYYYRNNLSDNNTHASEGDTPLMDEDLFLIIGRTSSWEYIPESPVMIAYNYINTFLQLGQGQSEIVKNPIRNYLISIQGGDEQALGSFRNYWKTHVLGDTEPPIIQGQGKVQVDKISADSDAQLFPQYTEFLISMIALSFSLSKRDYNLTEHDNRATSEASADSSFQEAILPIAKTIIEALSSNLVEYYSDSKYDLEIGEIEPRRGQEEATIAQSLYQANIATKNEMRQRLGLDVLPDADIFSFQEGQEGQEAQGGETMPQPQQEVSEESNLEASRKKRKRRKVKENNRQLSLF